MDSNENKGFSFKNPFGIALKLKFKAVIGIAIAGFFGILVLISVLSYLLGVVQKNVERVENLVKGACFACTNEELAQMKEDQFKQKILDWKINYPNQIDEVVLASTVLFQGDYYKILDSNYSKDYDSDDHKDGITKLIESFSVTGGEDYNGVPQASINAIDAAGLIMFNAAKDGKYDEESYKKAIAGTGFADNALVSGLSCGWVAGADVIDMVPILGLITGTGNVVDRGATLLQTIDICNNGFIGATFDEVKTIKDENEKQKKKDKIADDIIKFSEFYKYLFRTDEESCTFTGSTGDYAKWRQYDDRWGNVSIGSSTVKQIGCTSVSLAIQFARSGTQITNLPSGYSEFNPGAFVTSLSSHGGYTGNMITWSGWNDIAPNARTLDPQSVNISSEGALASKLSEILSKPVGDNNQPFIILQLTNSNANSGYHHREHWIAVQGVENGKVIINDPGHDGTSMSEVYSNFNVATIRTIYFTDVPFGSSSTSTNNSVSTTANYSGSEYQQRLKGAEKYYQCSDYMKAAHGSMCSAGCEIASLAGISYLYTGNDVDVASLADAAIKDGAWIPSQGGVGTKFDTSSGTPTITGQFGLSGERIEANINKIKEVLKSGKKIMTSIQGSPKFNATSNGHYIVLDHYDESNDKIYVFNSSGIASANGYFTPSEIDDYVNRHQSLGMWAISSSKVNYNNSCDTGGTGDMSDLLSFVAYVEGSSSCNYKGKGPESGYRAINEGDGAGMTTAFGITERYDANYAATVGYSNFTSDIQSGCTDKEYIDKMFPVVMQSFIDVATNDLKDAGLNQAQIYVMASVAYNTGPAGSYKDIAQKIKSSGKDSFAVFDCMKTQGCGWTANFNDGLVRRRMAEYEAFKSGNFNAAKPTEGYGYFAGINTDSKWKDYMNTHWPTNR